MTGWKLVSLLGSGWTAFFGCIITGSDLVDGGPLLVTVPFAVACLSGVAAFAVALSGRLHRAANAVFLAGGIVACLAFIFLAVIAGRIEPGGVDLRWYFELFSGPVLMMVPGALGLWMTFRAHQERSRAADLPGS
jgi:hypothetical protein